MRRVLLCLSLCLCVGCGGGYPEPPKEVAAPFSSVDTTSLKQALSQLEKSGQAGSGIGLIRSGVNAVGKEDLKKDMDDLAKAELAGQKSKVKQIAAKMLKSL